MANIIFGLVALALGLWGLSVWWWSVVEMLRGVVPLLLVILGFIALGAGITRVRDEGTRDDVGLAEELGRNTVSGDE
ncbi:MAG: hypothetical protein HW380_1216 [Magnetococcales bacterium]|nr:hypothetical protein [Magnetococcales bacterium]HIJ84200.1 hypothetical protein [Magnetococcales bacterium]